MLAADHDVLWALGTCLTWLAQSTFAYLLACGIARFLRKPRQRIWVWSVFLAATLASWCVLWISSIPQQHPAVVRTVAVSGTPEFAQPNTTATPVSRWHLLDHASEWTIPIQLGSRIRIVFSYAGYAYGLIVILLSIAWVRQTRSLRVLLRNSTDPSPELLGCFANLCLEMGVRRCQLRAIGALHSPATAYWRRPMVLIPSDLTAHVSHEQLLDMLRHELAHVRRRDYLWERVTGLACRVLFFHPGVWTAHQQLRRQRELACDEHAAGPAPEDRLRYADSLLSFARWRHNRLAPGFALEFAAIASPLSSRVHSLLLPPDPKRRWRSVSDALFVGLAILALAAVLPSLVVHFYQPLEKQIVALAEPIHAALTTQTAPVIRTVYRATTITLRRTDVAPVAASVPEVPAATAPDMHEVASVTQPLSAPAVPVVAPRVSLNALARAQSGLPSYSTAEKLRQEMRAEANWNSSVSAASRQEKQLGKVSKTAISAAVYTLTYLTHEATESEGVAHGKK